MNSLALVAIFRTSAKRTEFCLSAHKNMRSRTKKAIYINICVICDQIKHIQGLYNLSDIFINENYPPATAMNKEFPTQTVARQHTHNSAMIVISKYYNYTSTIPCICCLSYRHDAITRYHIHSVSFKTISS